MSGFRVLDAGFLGYLEAAELQRSLLEKVLAGGAETLILVEHPPTLTLGANFHAANLLHSEDWYGSKGVELFKTDRGGDVTFHGPGQLVVYPIFSLEDRGKDLHLWLRALEERVIETLDRFSVAGARFPPHTGVWVGDRKICAMGIKVRRWVSMHGLALNCNNDLSPFDWIVPCGIKECGVTSLERELGRDVTVAEVKSVVIERFRARFAPPTS